jgi:HAD superfamily hydrolase (TIGR01509 family)
MIEAVVFDLDGVLVESEEDWEQARRDVIADLTGAAWSAQDQRLVLGTNLRQCTAIMNARHPSGLDDEELGRRLIARRMELYAERLVILPGAVEAVLAASARYPVAIASSSPPQVIRHVLERMAVQERFQAIASSDEVERGKPAPDVYLLACDRLGVDPRRSLALEDSDPGIRSAAAAGMRVVAIPNPAYPPAQETFVLADVKLATLAELDLEILVARLRDQ